MALRSSQRLLRLDPASADAHDRVARLTGPPEWPPNESLMLHPDGVTAATPTRLQAWRRGRHLRSDQRTGAYARAKARKLRAAWLRANWRVLAVVTIIACALVAPLLVFLPRTTGAFVSGAFVASVAFFVWHMTVVASGSASLDMGALAESWTASELRRVRDGSVLLNRVLMREGSDIDHVLVGSFGVVVVETKWMSPRLSDHYEKERVAYAARQVADGARQISGRLGRSPHVPVSPAVVVWPADADFNTEQHGNVVVLSGGKLRGWIAARPGGIDPGLIPSIVDRIDDIVRRRDAHEAEVNPIPRSTERITLDLAQAPLAFLVGLLAVAYSLQLGLVLGWGAVAVEAAVLVGLERTGFLCLACRAALLAIVVSVVAFVVAVIVVWLR